MRLSDFDYNLPEELIAQQPAKERSNSRLLTFFDGEINDNIFPNILDCIKENDLVIFNNSKVIKAQLYLQKNDSKISVNLNKPVDFNNNFIWSGFAKPAKKLKIGDEFQYSEGNIKIIDKLDNGEVILQFNINIDIESFLDKYGILPLPPYIKRAANNLNSEEDLTRYQTIYAKNSGSVAAPTAGLHFTDEILTALKQKADIAYVTLNVGAGTFLPVKTDDINQHKMHEEFCHISDETIAKIKNTKAHNGRVIAVGTTSLRVLESFRSRNINGNYFATDIFIKPGYEFKIVDCLITNFHMPKSTLLMLVAAFIGYDNMMTIYKHAVENKYRFFSYGDACFFEK